MANPNPVPPPVEYRFKPGQVANPSGKTASRKQLEKQLVDDLYADWKKGGSEAIELVRLKRPADYLRIVASLLPRQVNVTDESPDRQQAAALLELVRGRLEELRSSSSEPARAVISGEPAREVPALPAPDRIP